jgi:hypothetical protein
MEAVAVLWALLRALVSRLVVMLVKVVALDTGLMVLPLVVLVEGPAATAAVDLLALPMRPLMRWLRKILSSSSSCRRDFRLSCSTSFARRLPSKNNS